MNSLFSLNPLTGRLVSCQNAQKPRTRKIIRLSRRINICATTGFGGFVPGNTMNGTMHGVKKKRVWSSHVLGG